MRGASRASLAAARDRLARPWPAERDGRHALGDELFSVAGLLDREPALRRHPVRPVTRERGQDGPGRGTAGGKISARGAGAGRPAWSRALVGAGRPGRRRRAACRAGDRRRGRGRGRAGRGRGRAVQVRPGRRRAARSADRAVRPVRRAPTASRSCWTRCSRARSPRPALRLISQAAFHPRGAAWRRSWSSTRAWPPQRRERLVAEVHVAADAERRASAPGWRRPWPPPMA